jgi:hypothetical protein
MAKGPLQEAIERQLAEKEAAAREEAVQDAAFPGRGQPALFSNQFYVVIGGAWSRITFGERVFEETPAFHASFNMPTSVAKEMAETILRIIAEQEPIWEAERKAAEAEKK